MLGFAALLCKELLTSYYHADFVKLLFADIYIHAVAAQHVGKRWEPLAYHERNPEVDIEQNLQEEMGCDYCGGSITI